MGSEIFLPILKKQLNRTPKGNFKVIKLCRYGFPQLIENEPIVDGRPFPNLFWLTCPHLVKEISRLEEAGFIELFEEKVLKDERFRRAYLKAHQLERNLRKLKLPSNIGRKVREKLLKVGIGGIENPLGVKCLHLHLASYWGGIPNPVGREIERLLPSTDCPNNYCKRLMEKG